MNKNKKIQPQKTGTATPDTNEDDFETKTFSIRLIKTAKLSNALDLTFNEMVLKQLMIKIEGEMEKYHIMRLSLMREAASRDKAGMPQDPVAVNSEKAAKLEIDNNKITNDLL